MSWLSRLWRRKRERAGQAPEPTEAIATAAASPAAADPFAEALGKIAGVEPLGGDREQLRVIYSGTWDGPLFITVSASAGGGDVAIVDPGDDFRPRVMSVLSGEPAAVSPTRREIRGEVTAEVLAELRGLLAGASLWQLADGELRGTDGHWITVEVFCPERGVHRARDWCPEPASSLGRAAAVALRAAAVIDPSLGEHHWVRRLWGL